MAAVSAKNPFTPNFGQVPYCIAGRDALIADMRGAFDAGRGDPNLSTILVGARGTGKTALLSYLAGEAEGRGWVTANVTCLPGMLEDCAEQAARKASALVGDEGGRRLSGVSIGQLLGLEWESAESAPLNWRSRMTNLLERLDETGTGLLVTVDEVNPSLDEMISLAATYQHFVRENRKVALLMAGLPFKVSGLLGNESASFLRRACQHAIGSIDGRDVADALRQTVEGAGGRITDDALARAVEAVRGFPYMLQLVGYRSWQATEGRGEIGLAEVERGAALAERDLESRVLKATLDELSDGDVEFLRAMLPDASASSTSDVARRLGKGSAHVSTYKRRLLEQGVIEDVGRSRLRFSLPGLREYLPRYAEAYL